MERILLAGVNAKYSHINLAIRSILLFMERETPELKISFCEWTISHPLLHILREILEKEPELVLFSTYIWNVELVEKLAKELRKIRPEIILGFGGPEVSYKAEGFMENCLPADFVIKGEGELTCAELGRCVRKAATRKEFLAGLSGISGLFFRQKTENCTETKVTFSGERPLIDNLNVLPFAYTEKTTIDWQNQFVYYESSRGCPFSCSYCLSSLDKTLRYLPLERVFTELDFFIKKNPRTVKFTDRTFNLHPERYLSIWEYIIKNHKGKTAFHFEIEAEYITEESFPILARAPEGLIQFEIGIQSANLQTLKAVHRSTAVEKAAAKIRNIPPNIHVHLDLIAGLPWEDFNSLKNSITFTLALNPHLLQLGFLKVLSGTGMEKTIQSINAHTATKNDLSYKYLSCPPYEILETPWLTYEQIQLVKGGERILDLFYNSGRFSYTIRYFQRLFALKTTGESGTLFDFFMDFADFLKKTNSLYTPLSGQNQFSLFFDFLQFILSEQEKKYPFFPAEARLHSEETLRFDYIRREKPGSFPSWYKRLYNKEKHDSALRFHTKIHSVRESYSFSDYEQFSFNPLAGNQEPTAILFLYGKKAEHTGENYTTGTNTTYIVL